MAQFPHSWCEHGASLLLVVNQYPMVTNECDVVKVYSFYDPFYLLNYVSMIRGLEKWLYLKLQ